MYIKIFNTNFNKHLIQILIKINKKTIQVFNYIIKVLIFLIIVKHDLKIYHEHN
jgi:hypothetical protein